VQGLRQGLLRARALEEPVQAGLRHGPLRAPAPQGLVQGRTHCGTPVYWENGRVAARADFRRSGVGLAPRPQAMSFAGIISRS
jgi:hypothetical protein